LYFYLSKIHIPNTGYNRHFKYLKEVVFLLPPIEFQKEIIKKIDLVLKIIEKRKNQIKLLDDLIKSQFIEMFGDPIHNDKSFPMKTWNEVLNIKNGQNQREVAHDMGEYPIYGSGGIMGRANDFLCPENTVVVGRKGTINKPLLVKEKFWNG
jgi:type I restriction enzyme, S subunit